MPREVHSSEEFKGLLEKAEECRVVRRGDLVKIKLRTHKMLYTFKTNKEEADTLLKDVKAKIVEI